MTQQQSSERAQATGLIFALLAYGWWGAIVPIVFHYLRGVFSVELVAYRVIFGLPFLAILLTIAGRWRSIRQALGSRRTLKFLMITTPLIACNWFGFIFAVVNGRLIEASLGYYINPLVSVSLGVVFLHERLRPAQLAAIIIAAVGVTYFAMGLSVFPWISLLLAFSFGFYGLLRKLAPVDAIAGLTCEMLFILPLALAFIVVREVNGVGVLETSSLSTIALLAASGVATVLPLLWFTGAARRLRLVTMGFLQYISPTGQFLIAVYLFGEPLEAKRLITFGLIWIALALFSIDSFRVARTHASLRRARVAFD